MMEACQPHHWGLIMPGQVVKFMHDSELLRGNRAGETSVRPVSVYLPPQHEVDPERTYPVLFVLAPWTNAGRTQLEWRPSARMSVGVGGAAHPLQRRGARVQISRGIFGFVSNF